MPPLDPSRLIHQVSLNGELIADLARMNPWWEGEAQRPLPETRRHLVRWIHRRLFQQLAPIVVVRGPRQIGKTTAQQQVIADLLAEGVSPDRILRVQFDDLLSLHDLDEPILRIIDWFEQSILGRRLNTAASSGEPAFLFFDEVQDLKGWDVQLKSLVDSSAANVVVTGSSALRIEHGRDSLAGRITTINCGVLSLTEIAAFRELGKPNPLLEENGIEAMLDPSFWKDAIADLPDKDVWIDPAFDAFSARGGYPLVHNRRDIPWHDVADQLNETVIKRVITHDLRVGDRGRKRDEQLLEELFRLACRYAGQSPGATLLSRELGRVMGSSSSAQKIRSYLSFLDETLLLRIIPPLELRNKKHRGSPKLCLADHGLRASWLQEVVPLTPSALADNPHLTDLAGHIAESVVGSTLRSIGSLDLAHLPARDQMPEVDFVLTFGTRRIPLEVKYQRRIDPLRHTESLRTFIENATMNAPFGLLVTQTPLDQPIDPRVIPVPLPLLLALR